MSDAQKPSALRRSATSVGGVFTDYVQGILYLPRGFGYLASHNKLWKYAIWPLIINAVIISALGTLAIIFFPDVRTLIWGEPAAAFWKIVWYCYSVVLGIAFVFLLFLLWILLSGMIAGPFNSKLAARTRESLSGAELAPAGGIYIDIILVLINELKKFIYFALIEILILPLNLIPVVGNVAYTILGGYVTFSFLAYAFLEYSIESERWVISMRQRRQYMRSKRWLTLGFGTAVSVIFLIPLLNIFLAPIAVVGGAMLYEHKGGQKGMPWYDEASKMDVVYPPKDAGEMGPMKT